MIVLIQLALSVWAVTVAASDWLRRRIPNTLTFGLLIVAIAWWLFAGEAILGASIPSALLAMVLAAVLTLPFYALGWLGAGDAKLTLAWAAVAGVKLFALTYAIATIIQGGWVIVWGAVWVGRDTILVTWLLAPFRVTAAQMPNPRHARLPFGVFFGAAVMASLWLGPYWLVKLGVTA